MPKTWEVFVLLWGKMSINDNLRTMLYTWLAVCIACWWTMHMVGLPCPVCGAC